MIGAQRRETVEGHRRVSRGIRAGALDQHLVADLERHRQRVRYLLVHHVGGIAGRAREHARRHFRAVVAGAGGGAGPPPPRPRPPPPFSPCGINPPPPPPPPPPSHSNTL